MTTFTTFQLIVFSLGPSRCIISYCFDSCSHCSLLRLSSFGSSITDDMASEQGLEDEVTKSTHKVAAVSHEKASKSTHQAAPKFDGLDSPRIQSGRVYLLYLGRDEFGSRC